MKINSIKQQTPKQNFKGNLLNRSVEALTKHPALLGGLAGSSVVMQKIVMSGSEAAIGPMMDIGIGKTITKITDEKDGRTNEASKVQAIRTFSQAVGGTIVGIVIRVACIAAATALFAKVGEKAGGKFGKKIAEIINQNDKGEKIVSKEVNKYLYDDHMEKWGKNVGGALATLVMLVTNFIIDAPFINWINGKVTNLLNKDKQPQQAKEVK